MTKIRVLIADDHAMFREGLCVLLGREDGIEVVGEAADGTEALVKTRKLKPDIVLMDIAMPTLNGLEATKQIKRENPSIKVLILTMYETDQYIFEILQAGASGYILKKAASTELISGIKAIFHDDVYLYPSLTKKLIQDYLRQNSKDTKNNRKDHSNLTDRETEIIRLIADGKTNKEIATLLKISTRTVQAHRANLMEKLNIHDRTQLVRYAIRQGLLVP